MNTNIPLSLQEIFNIVVISVTLTLTAYHLLVYFGRRSNTEYYYLHFSAFGFFFAIYIFFTCKLRRFVYPTEEIRYLLSPVITYTSFVLMQWFAFEVFKILLGFKIRGWKLIPYYLPFILQMFSMLSSYVVGYQYYMENIFWITATCASIGPIYMIVLFIRWIVKKNLFKIRSVQIVFGGWLILAFDFILEELFTSLGFYYPLKETYLGSGLSVFVYAFALADRFNKEHKELKSLKADLELKVVERTKEICLLNEQKSTAFQNFTHEMRTPATLLQNYFDRCINRYPDDHDLLIAKDNIDKLVRDMINFLDAEKIEKGFLTYKDHHKINFTEYLNQKINLILPTADLKGIKIIPKLSEEIYLSSNIYALERIVNNLLDNALRYTSREGSITIELLSREDNFVELKISDTGIGIPLEKQEFIFDKYYQMSHSKDNTQGMGLGLYITKNVIAEIGGQISFISSNCGTCFSVHLPYGAGGEQISIADINYAPPIIHKDVDIQNSRFDKNKVSVLIVEDNTNLLNYLKDSLQNNYNIFCAINGHNAIEILESNTISLIISDIMMDVMDGHELLKEIRKNARYRDIPFMFLTAKTGSKDIIEGLYKGAVDYVQKPFNIDELRARIASMINYNEFKKKLFDYDKCKTIGMLTAGVCHEILNPLAGINGPLFIVERNIKEKCSKNTCSISESLNFIKTNVKRISDVVSTMRSLFNGDPYLIEPIDLYSLLISVTALQKNKGNISFDIDVGKDDIINTNRAAITQILINLISNSIESIDKNGIIRIEYNDKNELLIKDTGCGISNEDLTNIFNVSFTTKGSSGGSGLGLFIVKELVDRLGIEISISSQISIGTVVTLHFKEQAKDFAIL